VVRSPSRATLFLQAPLHGRMPEVKRSVLPLGSPLSARHWGLSATHQHRLFPTAIDRVGSRCDFVAGKVANDYQVDSDCGVVSAGYAGTEARSLSCAQRFSFITPAGLIGRWRGGQTGFCWRSRCRLRSYAENGW
jgi:hypothetical protein